LKEKRPGNYQEIKELVVSAFCAGYGKRTGKQGADEGK